MLLCFHHPSLSIFFLIPRYLGQQNMKLQQNVENMQTSQARLLDNLIGCCKEVSIFVDEPRHGICALITVSSFVASQQPSGERSHRLFSFLREELQKRGTKIDGSPPPEGQSVNDV